LLFDLDDGVIFDRDKELILTPEYASGQARTTGNLLADYGLIVYTDNPFGKLTKVLQLAGIKGFGTLAAAIAAVDELPMQTIAGKVGQLLRKTDASELKSLTFEVLVRVAVSNGRADRDSLQIHKIKVSNGSTGQVWESETYRQLNAVSPHRLHIDVTRSPSKTLTARTKIDDEELSFPKSGDRQMVIYFLAKQTLEDYLNQSANKGWVSPIALAQRLWQIKHENGIVEIPDQIKRQITENIKRWAAYAQRQGELTLSANIKLDSHYINSEILVFDSDIKKKIVDLIHVVNHEWKNSVGSDFQLIESKPGLGYHISVHPALVFITESDFPRD
jgi:hypothetical protein